MGLKIVNKSGNIRGKFIMTNITLLYIILIPFAVFLESVAENVHLLGFYLLSFYGINFTLYWGGRQVDKLGKFGFFKRGNGNDTERGQ